MLSQGSGHRGTARRPGNVIDNCIRLMPHAKKKEIESGGKHWHAEGTVHAPQHMQQKAATQAGTKQ